MQPLHPLRPVLQSPEVAKRELSRAEVARGSDSLEAYPNISAAAEILGVSASTISRRSDLSAEARGERDRVLTPGEVLRLGRIFRKRSINDVAQSLLERAGQYGDEARAQVEREVEAHFDEYSVAADIEELRRLGREFLPPELATEVEAALDRTAGEMPTLVEGYVPLVED